MPRRHKTPRSWQPEPTPAVHYVDPYRDADGFAAITEDERAQLRAVNQRIAAKPTLGDVIDYLFDETQGLISCDRMSLAFLEEDGRRVVQRYVRAAYKPLFLEPGFAEDLNGTSLAAVLESGRPRLIGDLREYLLAHPRSRATERLLQEGVRSSLTCPLVVEGRIVGFMFRSARATDAFARRHVELQMAISERLSQAVEKAWRIEQLEEANHAYLEMLSFVSHELKSPVASMVTDARLVADGYFGPLEDGARDKLERLTKKGEYLLELVREYLDLARVEGNELRAGFKPNVSLERAVIEPSIELVRPQLEGREMTVTVDSSQTPRLLADCDPTLLQIVVVNLLTNAAKYGRRGGRVVVRIKSGYGNVSVSVWNEGPGFSANDRARLFRRFSRLKDPEPGAHRGTGLGLYNAWRIIQLHHGRIHARAQPGEWAEFSFELPQPLTAEDQEAPDAAGAGT